MSPVRCSRRRWPGLAPGLLAFLLTPLPLSRAADWPGWRGPKRDGLSSETGLNSSWPKAGPPLLWNVAGCGNGYGSVAVSKGRVFVAGRRKEGECLIAFNETDGAELWATAFGTGDHSNGAPATDGSLVYAIGLAGDLVACEAATGRKVWSRHLEKDFGGKMMSGWGFSESPLIDEDRLICTPGGPEAVIVALDKRTGREIWRSATPRPGDRGNDGAAYSSVVISIGAGVKQYVQLTGRGLVSVRASDGKPLWSYNAIANDTANIPTPVVSGDHIFCSTGYGTGAALLRLSKDGGGVAVQEEYFLDASKMQNHHGGMVLVDGHVYAGNGHNNGFPICVNLGTGAIAWGGDERGPGSGSAAITGIPGHLLFRYENGVVALIETTSSRYNLEASFKPAFQEDKSWAHPVVAHGRLLLREQDRLMAYDLRRN